MKERLVDRLTFRATFQTDRFRLLPKKQSDRESEAKIPWPTYYLGLSRLFPVGESESSKVSGIDSSIAEEIIELHDRIMGVKSNKGSTVSKIKINEYKQMKIGISNEEYSSTANSSGQDNLGQIILSVLSFRELKKKMKERWNGGILLIDEIDATLHPGAQRNLLDYLFEQSKELDLQIVFTTHSYTLLDYITKKIETNKYQDSSVLYLFKRGDSLNINYDPTSKRLYNHLNEITQIPTIDKGVKIITEDDVARMYLNKIIAFGKEKRNHLSDMNLNILDTSMGWRNILVLVESDIYLYQNYICIFDPDIEVEVESDLYRSYFHRNREVEDNFFILPGDSKGSCLEKMIYLYVTSIDPNHPLFNTEELLNSNWQQDKIIENGPSILGEDKTKKYKKWYSENKVYAELALDSWIREHENEVLLFLDSLFSKTKSIDSKMSNIK